MNNIHQFKSESAFYICTFIDQNSLICSSWVNKGVLTDLIPDYPKNFPVTHIYTVALDNLVSD